MINTHLKINQGLCGTPIELGEGYAVVSLEAKENMVADEKGLIHGGFIFGLADYTSMLAVNHPNVVLAKAEVKFLKPVKLGDVMTSHAKIQKIDNHKYTVEAFVNVNDIKVFEGVFLCVVTPKHVLE
ncbi:MULTISPECIES: hotdog domain-containing protein [unclassified Hydrogenobaculum]|uniref:hotdog domain-containing protein n=1 Tax=Hydrogenobaculum sp. (strain Y04AAS1) TaxID=380749 RepID=UPI00059C1988|nr:PaaI family thioesterase [Hydrogenobaculum sp.]